MKNKRTLSIPFLIIAIIIGVALFKQFDFQTLSFENWALAIVYMVGLAIAVYVLVTSRKSEPEK